MQDVLSIPSVTGVDLSLPIAGPGARSYAFVVDWHIRLVAAFAWFLVGTLLFYGTLAINADSIAPAYAFGVLLPTSVIYFLYHPVIEVLTGGRTPGKRLAGIRVVKPDGAIPGVPAILIRNIFRLVDSLPILYCIGLATTLFTKQSVRFGDIAAGTLLVYDREQTQGLEQLRGDAVNRLGIERAELIRDVLRRWNRLALEKRWQLGRDLLLSAGVTEIPNAHAKIRNALEDVLRGNDGER